MESLLRISEAASLGIHAMAYLASAEPAKPQSVSALAEFLGVSEAHLSKVLQRLAKHSLVMSRRGPRGGFTLGRAAEEIRLLDVYEAIDGPLSAGACLLGRPICPPNSCVMGTILHDVYERVRDYLSATRLSDMAEHGPFRGLLAAKAAVPA